MHLLTEENIFIFLLQVSVLLGMARLLGEVFRRWGQPSISAEILVGILFGPTIFGRLAPGLQMQMFPDDPAQMKMLGTVAWLGILLFLLKAGLETNFATAWRQRNQAMKLSLCDLTLPMLIAFIPCMYLPARYMGEDGSRVIFSLFVAVIMTISALPVTARVLQDLKIYRTDLGLLIMSALTINDVAGWIVFAMILGVVAEAETGTGMSVPDMAFVLVATLVFAAFSLSYGSKIFNGILGVLKKCRVPEPSGSLTLVVVAGLTGGAITTWIGIHALFGFFIAGIMAGEAARLSERTRHIFDQMVQAILVPLFFTAIGLKLDFLGNFDFFLVLFMLGIGMIGRYVAAYLGGRLIGQPSLHSRLIADAHIPGGEMQIIIGMLALEFGVITETVYVAIVFGAIFTSVISGPLMGNLLKKIERLDWLAYLPVDMIHPELEAEDKAAAIDFLSHRACAADSTLNPEEVRAAVYERETQMSTAMDGGIALPHARVPGLTRSIVLLARRRQGLEWNSQDGHYTKLIFFLVTPEEDPNVQLQIFRGISRNLQQQQPFRNELLSARDSAEMLAILRQAQKKTD